MLLRHVPPPVVDRMIRAVQRATVPDLAELGLPRPEVGVYTRIVRDGAIPIIDVGLIDAVRRQQVEVVAAVVALDGREVVLAGGGRVSPDAVIVAAGYRCGLEPLVGHLGVLDSGRASPGHRRANRPGSPRHVVHRLHQPDQRHVP